MSSKNAPTSYTTLHPPVGTRIDGGSLELVEVLGVGGYGVVYRGVDVRRASPKSYAVKCLIYQGQHIARQRQTHIREIALHQIASAHPHVVSLHRVIEDGDLTYIIMDYAPDHDLFTQILHSCRYLGDDYLIKHIFLQLLDAIEYCHSLGIYHRDLKPENILCFDDGLRIALTDFGLATTDRLSEEFRTGSVYHMSPECQGGSFAPTGNYSPMFNDIWSLGIILLNLATGRNPWKSATLDDPTFRAYLQDPYNFLPTVLPISAEINDILIRMLEVDWRKRMTLPELRAAFEDITTFYSEGVIFEGSMARCPWEEGMDVDESDSSTQEGSPLPESKSDDGARAGWSKDSATDVIFANRSIAEESSYGACWAQYSSGLPWAFDPTPSESFGELPTMETFDRPQTPSAQSDKLSPCNSDGPSLPATPNHLDTAFSALAASAPRKRLTLDTTHASERYFNRNDSMTAYSMQSSMMQSAVENPGSFYLSSPALFSRPSLPMPDAFDFDHTMVDDKEMMTPSLWALSSTEAASEFSLHSNPSSTSSSSSSDSAFQRRMLFNRSGAESPDLHWADYGTDLQFSEPQTSQLPSSMLSPMTDVSSSSRPTIVAPTRSDSNRFKIGNVFEPPRAFFRRQTPPIPPSAPPEAPLEDSGHPSEPLQSFPRDKTFHPPPHETWFGLPSTATSKTPTIKLGPGTRNCGRTANLWSARNWLRPGKLFATAGTA